MKTINLKHKGNNISKGTGKIDKCYKLGFNKSFHQDKQQLVMRKRTGFWLSFPDLRGTAELCRIKTNGKAHFVRCNGSICI